MGREGGIEMLRSERIDSKESGNNTIWTSIAMGPSRVIDVDEWLYRASRVRVFTPPESGYVPRHRDAS
jgi:hypothetical protein